MAGKSPYSKGAPLDRALRMALRDTADCPCLPQDFARRVAELAEAMRADGARRVYPVAVGLTPPVQTGGDADDVSGLDFGLLWARHRDVAGFAYGSFGHQALGAMEGWQLSALYNESGDGSFGLQTAGLANLGNGSFGGLEIAGAANVVFGAVQGCQLSGLANLAEDFDGMQIAVANLAADMNGVQIGVYNQGDRVCGMQIGVVNMAKSLCGVQIGLSNYVENSPLTWFPVINIGF